MPLPFVRSAFLLLLVTAACGSGSSKHTGGSTPQPSPPAITQQLPTLGESEDRFFPIGWRETVAAAADFDGDGAVDLAGPAGLLRGAFPSRIFVAGSSWELEDPNDPAKGYVNGMAAGDVDGDGDVDLLAARDGVDALLVQKKRSTFVDATASRMPQTIAGSQDLALADVDGDGDLDALIARSGQDAVLENRAGTFVDATATRAPVSSESSVGVAVGDVDGDGDPDAIWAVLGAERAWENVGGGFVAASGWLPADGADTFDVALADFDGDGDLDLARSRDDRVELLANDGAGSFTVVATLAPAKGSRLRIADEDGDGRPDVAARDDVIFGLWRNRGGWTFEARQPQLTPAVRWQPALAMLAWVDVDRDGRPDVITETGDGPQITFPRGNGYWTHDLEPSRPSTGGASGIAAGDVDGDGDVDLVETELALPRPTADVNTVVLNAGDGTWRQDASRLPVAARSWRNVAPVLSDVDGDGDLDLLAAFGNAPPVVLANDGRGFFALPVTLPAANATAIVPFDAEGDGDLDLLVVGFAGPAVLLVNDGRGGFADETGMRLPGVPQTRLARAVDVERDGALDLVLLPAPSTSAPRVMLWHNDGRGVFTDVTATNMEQPSPGPSDVVAADIDGDGAVDLVVALQPLFVPGPFAPKLGSVFWNDGAGVFATDRRSWVFGPPDADGVQFTAADLDLDGRPDMIVSGLPGIGSVPPYESINMLMNVDGLLQPQTNPGVAETGPVVVADLDGDGDPDLVDGATTRLDVHLDLRPRTLPVAGATFELQVRQPAGSFVPAVAVAPGTTPLGSLGTLRLEASSLVTLPPVTVPASGVATFDLPLPAATAGLPLFVQGVHVRGGQPLHVSRPVLTSVW